MTKKSYEYNFNPAVAFASITQDWYEWAEKTDANKFIVGLSGGKDSSIVATLAVKIFGAENVIGVIMPNGIMKKEDIDLVSSLCSELGLKYGINYFNVSIGDACDSILNKLNSWSSIEVSKDTTVNLPARLRMATLYAFAQSLGARVICTGNLSENMVGYATIYGDHAGAYAPLADLTVQEVIQLGEWLGLDQKYTRKVPDDGLCGQIDEDKLGFTYEDLDRFIRYGELEDDMLEMKIMNLYEKNKFKLDTVRIPYPEMPWQNYVIKPKHYFEF